MPLPDAAMIAEATEESLAELSGLCLVRVCGATELQIRPRSGAVAEKTR